MASLSVLTIRRPDDWHVHLRTGAMLKAVLPYTARQFARAIIMPNLKPPVTTRQMAAEYKREILRAVPPGCAFTPLLTCYLTDATDPDDLIAGFEEHVWQAAKLYPANATTNSGQGVTDFAKLSRVFAAMEKAGMPLLLHGEVTDPAIDIFDREAVFIERHLIPLLRDFPALRVVFEHATTREAADFVRAENPDGQGRIAATITAHHLLINRTTLFQGGLRPHFYCLPVAKREQHREALVMAATSAHPAFFLGTDTAPHPQSAKESSCCSAGCFTAPYALALYLTTFEKAGALPHFEAFASLNGPRFYRLPPNEEKITLEKRADGPPLPPLRTEEGDSLIPFSLDQEPSWQMAAAAK